MTVNAHKKSEDRRAALMRLAAEIERLQADAHELGEETLAFLLSHAKEEAHLKLSKGGFDESDTR